MEPNSSRVNRINVQGTQVGGSHYQTPIQPIEYIIKNELPYLEGNVIKYVSRHKSKGGVVDIDKAIDHLRLIKELHYSS